jgi:hypothetical protein
VKQLPSDFQVEKAKGLLDKRPRSFQVLSHVMTIFERYNQLSLQEKIKTPLAIMVSKSDILNAIAQNNSFQNAAFLKDADYNGNVNVREIERVDQEVRYLLQAFQEQELLGVSRRFSNVSFFATPTNCATSSLKR